MFNTFEIIKALCDKRKISINKLEEDLGYSKNTLYRLKTQNPGADKLKAIADYFQVTTDYLLGRTDQPNGYPELPVEVEDILSQTKFMTYGGVEITEQDRQAIGQIIQLYLDKQK